MMVTTTLISELEAVRATLSAERARIRSECERLPDIETDLAAVDRLLSHRVDQDAAEAVVDTSEAVDAPQDALEGAVAGLATTELAEPAAAVAGTPDRPQRASNWRRELAGLRQEDAAVRIAEHAGGTVTIAEVARVFMEVGLTRATGQAARSQASHVLGESTRFERVAKGVYRLIVEPLTGQV
jgi:hypothetical protein